jgi:cellulose synthase/poly-beta-1,6-N-acetylglucosamine synthase-like glycosyltransferase
MIGPFVISLCLLYAAGMLILAWALRRSLPRRQPGHRPSVSIIVAARNEETRIDACLSSLSRLTYQRDLLEIVVVDDHSDDGTRAVVNRHAGQNPSLRLIDAGAPRNGRHGKVNALMAGIEATRGEILLFTDADCTVPPEWVDRTIGYYADDRVAVVAGFITIDGRGWLAGIQGLDWLLLVSAASAAASLRFPVTAVGNNLSIRRRAYEQVGGFGGIPFSVTEDFALVKAVTTSGGGDIVIPLDPGTTIQTLPCRDLRSLFSQRKRWFVGGRGMPVSRMLAFAVAWLFHLVLIPGLFLMEPGLWLSLLAVKTVADLSLVVPAMLTMRETGRLRYWLPFQVYFWCYVVILPVLTAVLPKVRWKQREY